MGKKYRDNRMEAVHDPIWVALRSESGLPGKTQEHQANQRVFPIGSGLGSQFRDD
jgi:hypothetical protein